jgi:hypothetical protein
MLRRVIYTWLLLLGTLLLCQAGLDWVAYSRFAASYVLNVCHGFADAMQSEVLPALLFPDALAVGGEALLGAACLSAFLAWRQFKKARTAHRPRRFLRAAVVLLLAGDGLWLFSLELARADALACASLEIRPLVAPLLPFALSSLVALVWMANVFDLLGRARSRLGRPGAARAGAGAAALLVGALACGLAFASTHALHVELAAPGAAAAFAPSLSAEPVILWAAALFAAVPATMSSQRARAPDGPWRLGAGLVFLLGLGAFGATRGRAFDAEHPVTAIHELPLDVLDDVGPTPQLPACEADAVLPTLMRIRLGAGAAVAGAGPDGKVWVFEGRVLWTWLDMANAFRAGHQHGPSLWTVPSEAAASGQDLDLLASSDTPLEAFAPALRVALVTGYTRIHVVQARSASVDTWTAGRIIRKERCGATFELGRADLEIGAFQTWGALAREAGSTRLRVDPYWR